MYIIPRGIRKVLHLVGKSSLRRFFQRLGVNSRLWRWTAVAVLNAAPLSWLSGDGIFSSFTGEGFVGDAFAGDVFQRFAEAMRVGRLAFVESERLLIQVTE